MSIGFCVADSSFARSALRDAAECVGQSLLFFSNDSKDLTSPRTARKLEQPKSSELELLPASSRGLFLRLESPVFDMTLATASIHLKTSHFSNELFETRL